MNVTITEVFDKCECWAKWWGIDLGEKCGYVADMAMLAIMSVEKTAGYDIAKKVMSDICSATVRAYGAAE